MDQKSIPFKMDRVSFELQEEHDFTWLQSLGTVLACLTSRIRVTSVLELRLTARSDLLNMRDADPWLFRKSRRCNCQIKECHAAVQNPGSSQSH